MIEIRRATAEDIPALVHHREAMFSEMGVEGDYERMKAAFAEWLASMIPSEGYRAWVCCEGSSVVAGGGMVLRDKAPTPALAATKAAYIYNVFVEPSHRRLGLARRLMEEMHGWCRENGIFSVMLHTSEFARPLYVSMGYEITDEMAIRLDTLAAPT
jgi:GNAT superfamily N-acetyltransferase